MRTGWASSYHDSHEPSDLPQIRSPVVLPGDLVRGQRLHAVDVLPGLGELLGEVGPHVPAYPSRHQNEEVIAMPWLEARDDAQVAQLDHRHLVVRMPRARVGAKVADHDVPVVHVEIDDARVRGQDGAGCVSGDEFLPCWGVNVVGRDETLSGPLAWVGQSHTGSEETEENTPNF